MGTKKIGLIGAVLLSLSEVRPVAADASDYLPLAVGNSWTYRHEYYDLEANDGDGGFEQYSAYVDQFPAPGEPFLDPEFTISVLDTEVIDGKTYYVISDMPANWPPAPPHFIAGKKLRWEGTHLMERTADGERSVFRFDGANDAGYTVETEEGDLLVKAIVYSEAVNFYDFNLRPPRLALNEGRSCGFTEKYGVVVCGRTIHGGPDKTISGTGEQGEMFGLSSSISFSNRVRTLQAVIEGRTVVYKDLLTPTSISPSSWGQVKKEAQ